MTTIKAPRAVIEDFHILMRRIPYRDRIIHADQIKAVQAFLGSEEDVITNQQGKHWAKKGCRILSVRIDIRDGESWEATYGEAAKFVNRSEGYIKHTLRIRDSMPFKIGEQLVTVTRINRKKY